MFGAFGSNVSREEVYDCKAKRLPLPKHTSAERKR